ncbi:MAG: tyrosine-type recombinase/integrase [Microthrixaceae bacterium]
MRGGLREREPGVWEVRAEAGRDPVTGKRRQVSRTVRGTKREAQKKLNAIVAELDQGNHVGSEATFADVAERWLTLSGADLSPTTLRRYRQLLRSHIYPALGDHAAYKIRTSDLDDLYQGLIASKGLAPATVRQVHSVIRRAMSQAVRWGWISTKPAANTTPPRVTKPTITPPEVEKVVELLQLAHETYPEFGRFLHLAVITGARRGELCALKWERIDFENQTLTISRAMVEAEGGLVEKDTKTHSIRKIALDEQTLAILAEHRTQADQLATEASCTVTSDSYVFTLDPSGAVPFTPDHATKTFQRLRKQVGLDRTRLHDLRHFAATSLLAAGVPVRTVSGRLGHANASTTLGVYAHFVESSDQAAAIAMARLIAATPDRAR